MKGGIYDLFFKMRNAAWPLFARHATAMQFPHPIFIVSPPRSGSNFLFECLAQFPDMFHHREEANEPWRRVLKPVADSDFHDSVPVSVITPQNSAELYRDYYRGCLFHALRSCPSRIRPSHLQGSRPLRYLDKTIGNCFRLDALKMIFPEARFIFLRRDPRATISSMMKGWVGEKFRHRYATPVLENSDDATMKRWSYPAPPGWYERRCDSVAAACCWSWLQHMNAVLDFEGRMSEERCLVKYEDLTADLPGEMNRLSSTLQLEPTKHVADYLKNPPLSRTTHTEPRPDKWMDDREALLESWESVRETALRSGYSESP